MSDLVKWNPFKEINRFFQETERFFERIWNSFPENFGLQAVGKRISLDIKDQGREIVISGEIPDADKDKIDVAVHERFVVISGEKSVDKGQGSDGGFYWSRFRQVHSLPAKVRSDKAQVDFANGKLTIRVPKC